MGSDIHRAQDQIDAAGLNGRLRHAVVFCRFRGLSDCDAASFADRLNAIGPVRSGA